MTKIFLTACSAIALAATVPMTATAQDNAELTVPPIEFTEWRLDNGLRVIAVQDDTTANVMTSMWYDIGSKLDPEGRSGFAHLFEHILSRKTQNMPYNQINRMVDEIGGTRNASNGPDRTNYYEIVPAEYLERMLWTHAERMARPVIDEEVFETERGVVKEELRQRVLAPPYGRFQRFLMPENIYTNLPQRRPGIGSIEDLDSATVEDARRFHAAYYGPDTATLIVAGNFQMDELRSLVDEYFAGIAPRANPIPLDITIEEAPIVPRTVTGSGPNVPLPAFARAYLLPAADHPDMAALDILAAIISRGQNNRVENGLVKQGLAVSAGAFAADSEERGYFSVFGILAGGKTEAEMTAALDQMILDIRTDGVSEDEVFEAKNEILSSALASRETFSSRAFALGEAVVTTGNPNYPDIYLGRIKEVTSDDVLRVARQYLAPQGELRLRYVKGEGDPATWANPQPMPAFRDLPTATRAQFSLLPEGERMAPPAPSTPASYEIPTVNDGTLSNGIRILSAKTGETPIATMTVVLKAGSAVDPRGLAGRANFAANLAERGTSTRSAEQIAGGLERLGASIGTSANADGTYLSVTAPTTTFADAVAILEDVIKNATYPEEDFQRERKRALDNLTVALNEPGGIAGLLIGPVVYGDAPYGNQSGGNPASLAAMSRQDLVEYRATYWHPDLASIIVTGALDEGEAKAIAENAFGNWTAEGAAPALPDNLAGAKLPGRTLVVDLPGAGQAAVYALARGLSRGDEDLVAAQLANAVLGGSSTARLFEEIRTKRALSYGSYSQVSSSRDGGLFLASAQTKNESAPEVASIILGELQRIATEPVDAALIDSRRTLLKGGFQRSVETGRGLGGQLAEGLLEGIEPGDILARAASIDAAPLGRTTAAMARMLQPEDVTLLIVGDSSMFIDGIREMRGDVEVIAATDLDVATASAKR
ncbi:M16 family metallopeptidase [Sphingomicrobium flavum]|uniref:M16 family metallopeptidase n=1 Tax=Sphingomicrobium flavum TaxID=1229164 RepID=UPI0021AE1E4E|nr:pitrilysin family protein [Sphingomicrobium flavum]